MRTSVASCAMAECRMGGVVSMTRLVLALHSPLLEAAHVEAAAPCLEASTYV